MVGGRGDEMAEAIAKISASPGHMSVTCLFIHKAGANQFGSNVLGHRPT